MKIFWKIEEVGLDSYEIRQWCELDNKQATRMDVGMYGLEREELISLRDAIGEYLKKLERT